MASKINKIRPQKGYQEMALSSPADIVIGGGSAGVGKTWTLLAEPLKHTPIRGFGGVVFRRTSPMIRAEGGLWDASTKMYSLIEGVVPRRSLLEWQFISGVRLKFSHLEYEKNIYDWQGSEIPFIGFDELTHFTKKMFFYLLSRNRSTCGIKPYVRATCNPDPDSWVRELIDWWIGADGFPIPERQGVLRYFIVDNDRYIWGDSVLEVIQKGWHVIEPLVKQSGLPAHIFVKSLTFIGGSIYDNKALLEVDPGYLANLNAQGKEEKSRLLDGNWNVKTSDTDVYDYFKFKDIFTNSYCENLYKNAEMSITTDIALKGADNFVVFVWKGKILVDFEVMSKSKGNEVINTIINLATRHRVPFSNIVFDNDGVGGFVDGFIEGAREFKNGSKPVDGENYNHLKSQCFFRSGDAVARGEYYIPPHVANKKFNDNFTLKEQLLKERKAVKRAKPNHDGKMSVIPKHEMKVFIDGKSPDPIETFMMREYVDMLPDEPDIEYTH